MIRSKKERNIPRRWRIVFRAGGLPLTVRWAAKNTLKSSTWARRTSAKPTISGCELTRNPAKQRSVLSATSTSRGTHRHGQLIDIRPGSDRQQRCVGDHLFPVPMTNRLGPARFDRGSGAHRKIPAASRRSGQLHGGTHLQASHQQDGDRPVSTRSNGGRPGPGSPPTPSPLRAVWSGRCGAAGDTSPAADRLCSWRHGQSARSRRSTVRHRGRAPFNDTNSRSLAASDGRSELR